MPQHRTISSLRCNQEGVTALEFAMVSPVLVLFMMGIIEFSLIMFTSGVMESATTNTSRLGKTGYTAAGSSRQQQIVQSVVDRTSGLLKPEHITITTQVYSSFGNVGKPEPFVDNNGNNMYNVGETYSDINGNGQWDNDMAQTGLGNANDIVVYTVTYPWKIMTPIVSSVLGSTFTITARMVVKNEPYNIQS